MSEIVLAGFNAKYSHCSFGLRYLRANLGELRGRSRIIEMDLRVAPERAVERILSEEPRIVGIGAYIWNVDLVRAVVRGIKARAGGVYVVVGGPEVGMEPDEGGGVPEADHMLAGEADEAFRGLCEAVLAGAPPEERFSVASPPSLDTLVLPYGEYTDEDVARRIVYVEASRGCPFGCEYCVSSVTRGMRRLPLAGTLSALDGLLERGLTQFKFIDRSFNADVGLACGVLDFFLARSRPGLLLHFELVPGMLHRAIAERLERFAPGTLHLELGVQTMDDAVAARIRRTQRAVRIEENVRFLRNRTRAVLHADLIVGLPGESIAGFGRGFERLAALRPHAIQVNLLKRLRGTPIGRHDAEWEMRYSAEAPYTIESTRLISGEQMAQMARFARFWELLHNRGRFPTAFPLLWGEGGVRFERFLECSEWLHRRFGRAHGIALGELAAGFAQFLTDVAGRDRSRVVAAVEADYGRAHCREPLRIPGQVEYRRADE